MKQTHDNSFNNNLDNKQNYNNNINDNQNNNFITTKIPINSLMTNNNNSDNNNMTLTKKFTNQEEQSHAHAFNTEIVAAATRKSKPKMNKVKPYDNDKVRLGSVSYWEKLYNLFMKFINII